MASAAVDSMSSQDLDRQSKSPSPLSFWTKVSPNPVTSPTRTVFTIVDDNAENSPRPPRPELSQLEAGGMVNLSSQWTQEEDNIMKMKDAPFQNGHKDHQKPIKRVNFSPVISNFGPHAVNNCCENTHQVEEYDDDLVIVTDKNTQTEQPWPFNGEFSTNKSRQNDDVTTQQGSSDSLSSNSNSNNDHSDINNHNSNNNHGNNGEFHTNGSSTHDDSKASEAPTLKVEYVGKVWDAYINDFLLASDHISEAAIYDRASKSCIACSLQFAMSQDEFDHLLTSINCLQVAYRQGISVNDRHYKTVLADGRRGLMAKGEEHDGLSACQTRTLVLVALHDRRSKGRRCNDELMRLGDFFWAKGL